MSTRRVIALILFIPAIVAAASLGWAAGAGRVPSEAVVRFVIDGDTIVLDTGEKVRYLGIDAPEKGHGGESSDCYGRKARKANSGMVLGKKIMLRYDGEKHDRHGRLLAYVHAPDGTCVNVEQVKSGNAWIYTTPGRSEMFPELLKAQREAIGERRGLWGACPVDPAPAYVANRRSYVFHRPECRLGRKMSARGRTRLPDRWSALSEGFHPCRVCRP
ncbi:MAG: thermonuclease family protein [Syntrophobacteraceae bacterium]